MKYPNQNFLNRPVVRLAKRRWKAFLLITLLSTAASGTAIIIPLTAKGMIDQINENFAFFSYARMVLFFFCAIILRNIISAVILQISTMMRFELMREFLEEIHHKLLMLPPQQAASYHSGALTAHLLNDAETLISGIDSIINISVRYPLEYIGLMGVLFYISPPLTGIVFLAAIILGIFTSKKSRKLSSAQLARSKAKAHLFGMVNENISFFRIIRVFDNLKHRMEIFRKQHENLTELEKNFVVTQAKFNLTSDGIVAIFVFGALLLVGSQLATGSLTPGSVAAALAALITLSSSLGKYSRSFANLRASMRAGGYVEELSMQAVCDDENSTSKQVFDQQIRNISLQDIHFSQTTRPILQGVSLVLKPGRPYLLIGENGTGKSTIVDMLFGLYKPEKGVIYFNDCDQNNIRKSDLLNRMALVPQLISIFNDSFRYNLLFGKPTATEENLNSAAKRAGVSAALEKHHRSLDDQAGDRGSALSPGEAQRISLARALLREPDVLVMDEPTNNLDKETVAVIWDIINEYSKEHIVLVITHQVPPEHVDALIYRLDNGILTTA